MVILLILGFIFWWPVGLAILAYILWSKGAGAHWQDKMDRVRAKMESFGQGPWGHASWGPTSGNRAFDDYRTDTLRRLEEEQREFREFLQRLRMAKDKSEFDQFMSEFA